MKATIVFQKNWDAIHQMLWNQDGTPAIGKDGKQKRKYKYIINRGSSRSSKTISLIDCFDLYARQNADKRLTVWRDTKTDCKKTVLNDAKKHLRRTGRYKVNQTFNKTESIFTYNNGSTFEIHGTDDEETVHGLEQDVAWFNEPYKISRDTFDQIDQRTSDFIFIDYNPKKGHWVENLMKDKRAIVIDSTFKDNPFCPEEQRLKILSYQPVSMCRIVLEGALHESEALNYDTVNNPLDFIDSVLNELIRCLDNEHKESASAYKWSVYGLGEKAEKPNRIFTWNKITNTEYQSIVAPRLIVVDWGKVDPWGIAEIKYYDGELYIKELNYRSENEVRAKLKPSEIAQMAGEEEGIVTWMFKQLGIDKSVPVICDNNRPMKIAMLRRHGWESYAANKPKGSIIDGIDLLQNLKVNYTSDSVNTEYEQENYSYKLDSGGVVTEDPEDKDNHIIDPVRYGVLYWQAKGVIKII